MNRLSVLQYISRAINAKSYLEIGIDRGEVFLNMEVPMKFGVEPHLKLQFADPVDNSSPRMTFEDAILYEVTSDIFFDRFAKNDLNNGIDIAFVDGLHTYDQCLRDVKNCLTYLNSGGVIVIHDCNPLSWATAYPVKHSIEEVTELAGQGKIPGWNGAWNGDVWKALVHLRLEFINLNIFTLDLDWGLGIVTRGQGKSLHHVGLGDIISMNYHDFDKNRDQFLNLKEPNYIFNFL